MNDKKTSILVIVITLLVSCEEKSKMQAPINVTSGYITLSADKMYEYKLKAIAEGDTIAYNEIITDYLMMNKGKDFIYYSLIMSNKNKYSKASYDVYCILTDGLIKDSLKNELDSSTFELALMYLKKASDQGNEIANAELRRLRKIGIVSPVLQSMLLR